MNRTVIFIAAGLAAVALVVVLVLQRPGPAVESDVSTSVPPEATVTTPEPQPSTSAAAPSTPRTPRRPTTDAPAAPEPAAPVAEAPAEPAADVATLRIDSDVPGAQVFLDRQFVGAAPVTAENIKPGSHQLNVSAEGFEGIAQTIDVSPGPRDITVRFREVRLNAKIAVIHKHRIGSCKGELVATPQGIRYDTTDKDDAFTATLADLEAFQVEYLDKTLKVKVRRGKQFNFSDPEGNADRLFVFHRDVDKARTRISKGDTPAGQ
ncbi:MAG: PEGA domain-containing protein [Vicinamibacterales bacterium]